MMPVVCIWQSIYSTVGKQIAMPWEFVEARVRDPKPQLAKGSLLRWAFVECRDGRRALVSFIRGHAVMFDVDDGTTLAQLIAAFDGLYVIIHSTFGASETDPRWRVIVPLEWPVETVEEHDRAWRWLASKIEAVGGRPEYSARSAVQPFAVPARPPSGYYVAHATEGAFAKKEDAFAVIPKPEPLPVYEQSERSDTHVRRVARASKYLATMDGAIEGSGGSAATMRAAVALVRGFQLTPDEALRMLIEEYNPRCRPAWTKRELEHKIRQAHKHGRMPFGALAEKRRAA